MGAFAVLRAGGEHSGTAVGHLAGGGGGGDRGFRRLAEEDPDPLYARVRGTAAGVMRGERFTARSGRPGERLAVAVDPVGVDGDEAGEGGENRYHDEHGG